MAKSGNANVCRDGKALDQAKKERPCIKGCGGTMTLFRDGVKKNRVTWYCNKCKTEILKTYNDWVPVLVPTKTP
jgi:hypothetical protein